ncbi:MAG: glycosyltransferase family 39 protein [Chloroflexi bacterium]|nr:glycosyltransferase family 39 protein [Chloroflexota bacterium]
MARPADYIILNSVGVHPPGYFLLLHFFTSAAGLSAFSVRMPSVLVGIATVPLIYQVARLLFGHRAGLLAALLLALSPFHIGRSQEARMYPLVVFLSLLSLYLMLRLMLPARATKRRSLWIGYVLVATCTIFVHYYAALFVLAQTVFVVIWRRQDVGLVRRWLLAQVAVMAFLAPWFIYRAPDIWRSVNEKVLVEEAASDGFVTYWQKYLGAMGEGYLFSGWGMLLILLVLAVGVVVWTRRRPERQVFPSLSLCLVLFLVPVLLGFLMNLRWPFDSFPRLLSPTLAPLYVLAAIGLLGLGSPMSGRLLWATLLLVVAGGAHELFVYYQRTTDLQGQDYRPLIRELRSRFEPQDAIGLEFPWQVGYFRAYSPELMSSVYYTLEVLPVTNKTTQRKEALRAIWEARSDIRDVYLLWNGWAPSRWEEAMDDWWSKTAEATAVEGDLVGLAIWNYRYLPTASKAKLDDIIEGHKRLWLPTFGSTDGEIDRGVEGYLTDNYQKVYQEAISLNRLILFTLPHL